RDQRLPSVILRGFDDLGQHAAGRLGVQERDAGLPDADTRLLIDQLYAGRLQLLERVVDVGDGVGDVVKARAALLQVLADRRVGAEWAEKLDVTLADVEQDGLDTLGLDGLAMRERHPERPLIERDSAVEVVGGNADVIDSAEHWVVESMWREADRPGRS